MLLDSERDPDACVLWPHSVTIGGYGRLSWNGQQSTTHRLAWIWTHGPIPVGMSVLHNCPTGDNPRCVNPAHLWLGTAADNIRDAAKKGHVQHGDNHHARRKRNLMRRGEQHHGAKFTDEDVREIRAVWSVMANGKELAREYGVGQMCLSRIINRQTWGHVRNEE
jgi:hypothetical protein